MTDITERRFTPKEVAAAMEVSMEHVIRLINGGSLPAINVARPGSKKARWRIRESDWRQFEASRLNKVADKPAFPVAKRSADPRFKDVIKRY